MHIYKAIGEARKKEEMAAPPGQFISLQALNALKEAISGQAVYLSYEGQYFNHHEAEQTIFCT